LFSVYLIIIGDTIFTVTVTGGIGPYTVSLTLNGNPAGNVIGDGPEFLFQDLTCGIYNVDVVDSTNPPCQTNQDIEVEASLGDLPYVTISGGPCNLVETIIPLGASSQFATYEISVLPIPEGMPAALPQFRKEYTVKIDLTAGPLVIDTFYKIFGVDIPAGTQVNPQTTDITITELSVDGFPLILGDTVIGV